VNTTSVAGRVYRESEKVGSVELGRLAASLKDSIKWLQATTATNITTLLVWSGYGVTGRHCRVLGIHNGIIKLYPTSEGLLDMVKRSLLTTSLVFATISKPKARIKIK